MLDHNGGVEKTEYIFKIFKEMTSKKPKGTTEIFTHKKNWLPFIKIFLENVFSFKSIGFLTNSFEDSLSECRTQLVEIILESTKLAISFGPNQCWILTLFLFFSFKFSDYPAWSTSAWRPTAGGLAAAAVAVTWPPATINTSSDTECR